VEPKARHSIVDDDTIWSGWALSQAPQSGSGRNTTSYEQAMTEHTCTEISFPSDFVNAFEGIRAVLADPDTFALGETGWLIFV